MGKEAEEILTGINKPVAADATGVSIGSEAPDQTSRFNAMEKAGILQAGAVLASQLFGKKVKKQGGVNVFSGFDGASGAQTGLRKAGVPIRKYYASEIDKDAIGFTQHNYPETIQLGDIRNVDLSKLEPMDYGFFGFPCQTLSSANHNGNIGLRDMTTGKVLATLDDYEAAKAAGHELSSSSLFYEALKQAMVLKKKNPDVRLVFENVASMKPEFRDIIDKNLKLHLDLDPSFEMNTKGPTNRQRYLWTNAITRDDYNALSDRMKQVMPDDIIDQNAHHELSAKGAKDNQTDLFENKGDEVPADGKFEAKTNKWLKGKLSTATAGDGAGTLMKNGLEYNMTKKEMNRSQGNPENLGLDYGLSDRQFAKLIGNGWDQFQFKPIFDRFALEAKGNIPKSEGRLGDENALKAANATYLGTEPNSQFGTRFYHSQGSPIEKYGNEIGIPRGDTPNTEVAFESWHNVDSAIRDLTQVRKTIDAGSETAARIDSVLNKLQRWKTSNRSLTKPPALTPHEARLLEEIAFDLKYSNVRPGIWNANSKRRFNSYGPYNYRIDIPARDVADRTKRGQMSIRGNYKNDIVTNVFEPIPARHISPAQYENDPLLQGIARYTAMKDYNVDSKTAAQLLELQNYIAKQGSYLSFDGPSFMDAMDALRAPETPFTPAAMAYLDNKMASPSAFDRNLIGHMQNGDYAFARRWFPNTLTQVASSYFRSPGNWNYYSDMINKPRMKELMPAIDDYLSTQKIDTARIIDMLNNGGGSDVIEQLPKTFKAWTQPLHEMAQQHGDTPIEVFRQTGSNSELRETLVGAMLEQKLPTVNSELAMNIARYLDGPVVDTMKPYLVALSEPAQTNNPSFVADAIIKAFGYDVLNRPSDAIYVAIGKENQQFMAANVVPILQRMAAEAGISVGN